MHPEVCGNGYSTVNEILHGQWAWQALLAVFALKLVATAATYFAANTLPVATIISLTEHKSLRRIWADCYFWSFPFYLVGASVSWVFSLLSERGHLPEVGDTVSERAAMARVLDAADSTGIPLLLSEI